MAVYVSRMRKVLTTSVSIFFALVKVVPILLFIAYNLVTKGKGFFENKKRETPPKILSDPKWGRHHRVHLPQQKINLHYVEKGNKDKPLLLCLHGFPDCWFSYRDTLVEFSKDFWVVAVDMRGYGESDKPAGRTSYKVDLLIEDIKEFIEVLGKDKCTLVAHDWGGVLGWMLVNKYPDLFNKHVSLNGPHLNAFTDHYLTSFNQAKNSWYIVFFQLWYLPEMVFRLNDYDFFSLMYQKTVKFGKKLTDEELEVYKYYFSQEGAITGPVNYYRNSRSGMENMRCDEVESLIIWGALDTALDIQIACNTFRYSNNLSIKIVPDSGHFILQEFPDEVHKHIWKFLAD